ncbi:glycosyltransferase [Thioalkalivibrio sulfidiphilus]|uniref:glycosyltransferase n=1 Tax=Thioalkalivibrio sulfidiphilus TaxID=1033854 RepID=UPI003BB1EA22
MTALRILHVISTLSPASGGPTQVLRELARAQASAGHRVSICTTDRDNPVQKRLPDSYFQEILSEHVELKAFRVEYAPLLVSLSMAQWLRHNLRAFDIVHIHGLYRFPPTYAAWQARRLGVPYVIRAHGALDPYLHARSSSGKLRLKGMYERWFDLPNLHAADAIHYTAEEERVRASILGLRARSFIVPNGLDWARFREPPVRGTLRVRWGLGEAPLVLFLGRLHFKKGLDLLIPAFDALHRSLPEVRLVIAGPENDDYGQQVRSWVQERGLQEAVHFVGPLEGADVVQAYVDADVFALPSYTENFGMTVAEAMACALPVVISDQVNIHAEVSGADAGLVTRCDANEVAAALEALLRNSERRRAMGQAGRRLVQERYSWPSIVEMLTAEYQNIIDRHPPADAKRRGAVVTKDER